MVRRLLVVVGLVATALFVLPAAPATAQTRTAPAVANSGGTSTMASQLTCPEDGTPLTLGNNAVLTHDLTCTGSSLQWIIPAGIVVDLWGHTVTIDSTDRCSLLNQSDPGCTFVVLGTLRNGHVVDGDVKNFGLAEHLDVRGGMVILQGAGLFNRGVVNGGQVVLQGGGHLKRSWVIKGPGVLLFNSEMVLHDFEIHGNIIAANDGPGVSLNTAFFEVGDDSGKITGNLVVNNTGTGISLTGQLPDLGAIDITYNIVANNGGDGIRITGSAPPGLDAGGPVTLMKNLATFNKGHGIDASWLGPRNFTGIVDGGRNVAFANQTAPDCLGVVCS